MDNNDKLIEDIIRHLDSETNFGSMRMSVNIDEKQEEESKVNHKTHIEYGRPANETVGLLDMYSDIGISNLKDKE